MVAVMVPLNRVGLGVGSMLGRCCRFGGSFGLALFGCVVSAGFGFLHAFVGVLF